MKKVALIFCFTVIAFNTPFLMAQNFFWSTTPFGGGAVNGDFSENVQLGDSGTTFLYYDAAGVQNIENDLTIDFSWETSGIARFTAAETLDFDITIQGVDISNRWGDFAGPAGTVTDDAVLNFFAIQITEGVGILVDNIPPGSPFVDEGYDTSANAFLIGSFDWTADNLGTTSLQIDRSFISDGGFLVDVPYNSFTLTVVPEPATSMIMIFGSIVLVARRTRRFI